jgi:hypothetical protein
LPQSLKFKLNSKRLREINKSELMNTDGRFPSYVIVTSRGNLEKKYGANTADVVIESMRKLSLNIVDCGLEQPRLRPG